MDIRPIDANALLAKPGNERKVTEYDEAGYAMTYHAVPKVKIDEAPSLSLNTLRDAIYEDAVAHGLWEDDCGTNNRLRAEGSRLIRGEARELDRAWFNEKNYTEELADVVIMCFSVAGKLGIDIDAAIRRKMEINKKRLWKHGKE